jgi:hypothetical protein
MSSGPRIRGPRIVQQIIVGQRSEEGDEIGFLLNRERKSMGTRQRLAALRAALQAKLSSRRDRRETDSSGLTGDDRLLERSEWARYVRHSEGIGRRVRTIP